jgi:hypothetical protein
MLCEVGVVNYSTGGDRQNVHRRGAEGAEDALRMRWKYGKETETQRKQR